uniref:Uncharacterized protein n=1 Tax=viral metagenome TaxID=1070528 RepID=A0A6C0BLX0_9ZZZZ
MEKDYIIGIDLGTTYSCVAVWKNGHVEIIPNDMGGTSTPSYVSFTECERYVGQLAKDQAVRNPQNTVYDIKRLIGRRIDDQAIQSDLKQWPFTVTGNAQQQPTISTRYKNETHTFFPEEISAMILERLKIYAQDYLNFPVTKAVITVPAYFTDSQRQATADAARIAGLQCMRIINEPTAAALAYGLDKISLNEEKVLIYDLGGGTLDVSLLEIENGTFEVIATSGDAYLGGEDFDHQIVVEMCRQFNQRKPPDVPPIETNPKALRKLKMECEKAKIALSTLTQTNLDIDALHQGVDFSSTLSRTQLEELCLDLFKKCLDPVKKILEDAQIQKHQIQEIVLIGGSTRIPWLQQQLKNFFGGKELNKSVHPDEAVARGAAIQGSILSKNSDTKTNSIVLVDVTPLSLGVETAGGIMSFIIDRNTPIPCTKKDVYTTYADNQRAVTINIYEGERQMTRFNHKLGQFDLLEIPPGPKGGSRIEVTFDVDNNGILTVTACDITSQIHNQIKIVQNKGRLSEKQIAQLIEDASKYSRDDFQLRAHAEVRNKLESLIYQTKNDLTEPSVENRISPDEKNRMIYLMSTYKKWLDETPDVAVVECENNRQQLDHLRNMILTRVYADIPTIAPPSVPTSSSVPPSEFGTGSDGYVQNT